MDAYLESLQSVLESLPTRVLQVTLVAAQDSKDFDQVRIAARILRTRYQTEKE